MDRCEADVVLLFVWCVVGSLLFAAAFIYGLVGQVFLSQRVAELLSLGAIAAVWLAGVRSRWRCESSGGDDVGRRLPAATVAASVVVSGLLLWVLVACQIVFGWALGWSI